MPKTTKTIPAAADAADITAANKTPGGKLGILAGLVSRPEGATIDHLVEATGWQAHSVRGAMSGALRKKHGFTVTSAKAEGGERVYRATTGATA